MDSVLENEKEINTKPDSILPDTPREAINKWFEAKGGHISSIDKDKRREIAQKLINLNLYDSGIEKRPTVIVKDLGIGIHPDDFPTTILGLGGSLKRGKHYLLGAYGWGGSQTFLWCNGATDVINAESIPLAIIVSRKNPLLLKGQKDEVGWTIVRYRDTPNEKHGVFQYLVNQDNSIPRCDPKNLPPSFQYGTQINHLAYNLESFHGRMTLTSYRLFQSLMFDPVLPFWLYDSRHDERRTISGNLSRLSNEEKSNVEYHSLINQETQIGKIIIRYWVFKSKEDGYHLDSYLSKPGASDSIFITLNGQQYSSLSKQIIKDAGSSFLSDYIIFQIECDNLPYQMKKNVFPSTREDIREQYKEMFKSEIQNILKSDEELKRIEEAKKKEQLISGNEDSLKRVKRYLDKLISVNKRVISGGKKGTKKKKKETYKSKDPPTIFKILPENRSMIEITPTEEKKISILTDADNDFLYREKNTGNIELFIDNPKVKCNIRRGLLRDGHLNFYLNILDASCIGEEGNLTCRCYSSNCKLMDTKSVKIMAEPPPLPCSFPPTIFNIINEEETLMIKRGRRSLVLIECNGPDGILEEDKKANLKIDFFPEIGVKLLGQSDLSKHKIRVFLTCPDKVELRKQFELKCALTIPNSPVKLESSRQCIIIEPQEDEGEEGENKVEIPNYDVISVQPDDKNWVRFQWNENAVGKYMKSGEELILYVSLGNTHYLNVTDSNEISADKFELFKERYISYIAYHLWLLSEDKAKDEEISSELNRIVQTVLLGLSQDSRLH